ncbi:alpha-1,2-Mannosidase [Paramicrosporidium saccamoebae]|uniref:alpha-1,2-Mannosidase n=1 Tax=Paramicrosporidium saccamoebae TaxID=1246581 RepID=A0A2H9TMB8_9FUNG|nr:alpha-1,2-Mannosidase [Paramicrosporidium saccamoebae]
MPRRVYKNTVKKIQKRLIKEVNGRHFIISRKGGEIVNQQDHSACMLPGLLALGAHDEHDLPTMELAGKLMESCYRMYSDQKSGLAPAIIATTGEPIDKNWRQGPEVMQSLFILWRVTKDPKYRRWGVEIAQAINRRTKVGTGGYAGVVDVTVFPPKLADRQDGMATIIRFFYLLCTTPEYLPLDEWVFSKEGHPFPINWKGTAYSKGITSQPE